MVDHERFQKVVDHFAGKYFLFKSGKMVITSSVEGLLICEEKLMADSLCV